jgi:hypothetical protein
MSIWRLGDQRPPAPRRVKDDVVMRFDHVYEVEPGIMGRFSQQDMPAWDTLRIVDSRWEHLDWMHKHFADEVLSTGLASETGFGGGPAETSPDTRVHPESGTPET